MDDVEPQWLTHSSGGNSCEVYSVHVSPDGKRLASGGLDCQVRIWSTKAVFQSDTQQEVKIPKQLCSLSHHSGAVLTVRFSGNNRYLASGSDDKIVLVYERDQTATARPVFGGGEAQTEVWRTHRRLAGHENDVQDLSWSADSSVLVSVGLDSKVIVWSGTSFERLKRIDVHQSHVKGLAFDPANKYFATASDDRTVKIHRFTSPASNATSADQAGNFSFETTIQYPFNDSPLTTYFRRCSWSPDGAHIAASNAVNGPVSSVAIINRGNWSSDINLIGHEGPVEVCAFAPRMFSVTKPGVEPPSNPVTVIACGGQDKALSIWNTSNPRPLLIIQEVSTKTISDIAWSPDGNSLFFSSLDGLIMCASFQEGDLGYVLPLEENERSLQKYGAGRKGATLPEGPDSMRLEMMSKASERREVESKMGALMMDGQNGTNGDIPMANTGAAMGPQWQAQPAAPEAPPPAAAPEPAENKPFTQKVTITKEGKRRVAPLLVSTGGGHLSNLPNAQLLRASAAGSGSATNLDPKTTLDLSRPYDGLPKAVEPVDGEEQPEPAANGKRIAVLQSGDAKASIGAPEFIRPAVISPAASVSQIRLAVPKLRTFVTRVIDANGDPSANIPGVNAGSSSTSTGPASTDIVFEAKNSREPTRLTISRGGQALWVDFLQKPVLLVTGNSNFWCAACEDGSLHVFTPLGRRMLNTLVTEAQPCFLDCRGWFLMCITSIGIAHVWNIKTAKALHPPVSLAPVLDCANTYVKIEGLTKAEAILDAGVNSEGTMVVSLTNGDGYSYSRDLCIWQKLTEAWWAVGSQYWDSNTVRPSAAAAEPLANAKPARSAGIIPWLERRTTNEVLLQGRGRFLQRIVRQCLSREGFEGFETAVSVAHLENRMAAAIALGAQDEFKTYLLTYARRIAAENMKGKVEELCRDLMGPLDVAEGEEGDDAEEEICGWNKRDLLKQVLTAIGKHRDLQRILLPYARMLGIMETDDEVL
ncbi:TUP1-like enhancer of split-domain-containing protein [Sphaerosporella brunnea]|uniref:Protein HIR n=1 Tax=Sphaerosporella brunnea TaxID=1250544 RepID=A0A5J5EL68_9PEZI|nr:TUP1-like enhancer of split-domain-containing protein [Sphaerosporella brunnea]